MPCMKDYGITWDENGTIAAEWVLKMVDGETKIVRRPLVLPKYRKIANQHGVIKFIRVN